MNTSEETRLTLEDFLSLIRAVNAVDMERLKDNDQCYIRQLEDEYGSLAGFSPGLLATLTYGYNALWSVEDIDLDAVRWEYLRYVIEVLNLD